MLERDSAETVQQDGACWQEVINKDPLQMLTYSQDDKNSFP